MAQGRRVSVAVAKGKIGCSDDFVRDLIEAKLLDAIDISRDGAKRALWSISEDSIERYMASRKVRAKENAAGVVAEDGKNRWSGR